MISAAWIAAALVLGSLPFSLWIGKIFLHKDIRRFGDGSPGATNVARAGGKALYIMAALLDAFKGTLPVWLSQMLSGITGWELAAVAVAPVLGHAFSPFLNFRGGMGMATTFGVWLGLTGWLGPVIMALCIGFMFVIQKNWVWASVAGMTIFLIILMVLPDPFIARYRVPLLSAGIVQTAILVIKRYTYFKSWPEPQSWMGRPGRKS
ncbi:MAG: glycerol-3-phosphate acyltransferase [Chloroflexi bacterium]|nr:glycerol-3-phosphate acyltransferase [Chloroflexota bacterium]